MGGAAEYVEAMWLILQQNSPDNYLISTGQTRSLEYFVNTAFALVGLDWLEHIEVSDRYLRPTDILSSYSNPSKAQESLGWAAKTKMVGLVQRMVEEDLG